MSTATPTRCLSLARVPHPSDSQPVSVFADWQAACAHLRDHVLVSPECLAWAIVCPQYADLLDPADGRARREYSLRAWESQGGSAQPLYDLYAEAIRVNAADARHLAWVDLGDRGAVIAFGLDGVLMVFEAGLRTAFLPGQGDAERTAAARSAGPPLRRPGDLRRERGMRPGREAAREDRARQSRQAGWSLSEQLYYLVFRPAVQFLRAVDGGRHGDSRGRPLRDYHQVAGRLPRSSQLKYADWSALRIKCGRPDPEAGS